MTGSDAAYIYRRDIAAAIRDYGASLREIFLAHDSPIPPSPECAGAMGNAWGTCRVRFALADIMLEKRRLNHV